jgi:hypothetical protein
MCAVRQSGVRHATAVAGAEVSLVERAFEIVAVIRDRLVSEGCGSARRRPGWPGYDRRVTGSPLRGTAPGRRHGNAGDHRQQCGGKFEHPPPGDRLVDGRETSEEKTRFVELFERKPDEILVVRRIIHRVVQYSRELGGGAAPVGEPPHEGGGGIEPVRGMGPLVVNHHFGADRLREQLLFS